jgi:acyl-CoA synthetase (AMP-forming)/AMP-acid ligase II
VDVLDDLDGRLEQAAGAHHVADQRDLKPGDYVLIHLDNCIEAMLAWFACVEIGAIAVLHTWGQTLHQNPHA